MSSLHISAPMSLDAFLAKAAALGWTRHDDVDGTLSLDRGRASAFDLEAFEDAAGETRIMFECSGDAAIDELDVAVGAIAEHDEGFRAILGIEVESESEIAGDLAMAA